MASIDQYGIMSSLSGFAAAFLNIAAQLDEMTYRAITEKSRDRLAAMQAEYVYSVEKGEQLAVLNQDANLQDFVKGVFAEYEVSIKVSAFGDNYFVYNPDDREKIQEFISRLNSGELVLSELAEKFDEMAGREHEFGEEEGGEEPEGAGEETESASAPEEKKKNEETKARIEEARKEKNRAQNSYDLEDGRFLEAEAELQKMYSDFGITDEILAAAGIADGIISTAEDVAAVQQAFQNEQIEAVADLQQLQAEVEAILSDAALAAGSMVEEALQPQNDEVPSESAEAVQEEAVPAGEGGGVSEAFARQAKEETEWERAYPSDETKAEEFRQEEEKGQREPAEQEYVPADAYTAEEGRAAGTETKEASSEQKRQEESPSSSEIDSYVSSVPDYDFSDAAKAYEENGTFSDVRNDYENLQQETEQALAEQQEARTELDSAAAEYSFAEAEYQQALASGDTAEISAATERLETAQTVKDAAESEYNFKTEIYSQASETLYAYENSDIYQFASGAESYSPYSSFSFQTGSDISSGIKEASQSSDSGAAGAAPSQTASASASFTGSPAAQQTAYAAYTAAAKDVQVFSKGKDAAFAAMQSADSRYQKAAKDYHAALMSGVPETINNTQKVLNKAQGELSAAKSSFHTQTLQLAGARSKQAAAGYAVFQSYGSAKNKAVQVSYSIAALGGIAAADTVLHASGTAAGAAGTDTGYYFKNGKDTGSQKEPKIFKYENSLDKNKSRIDLKNRDAGLQSHKDQGVNRPLKPVTGSRSSKGEKEPKIFKYENSLDENRHHAGLQNENAGVQGHKDQGINRLLETGARVKKLKGQKASAETRLVAADRELKSLQTRLAYHNLKEQTARVRTGHAGVQSRDEQKRLESKLLSSPSYKKVYGFSDISLKKDRLPGNGLDVSHIGKSGVKLYQSAASGTLSQVQGGTEIKRGLSTMNTLAKAFAGTTTARTHSSALVVWTERAKERGTLDKLSTQSGVRISLGNGKRKGIIEANADIYKAAKKLGVVGKNGLLTKTGAELLRRKGFSKEEIKDLANMLRGRKNADEAAKMMKSSWKTIVKMPLQYGKDQDQTGIVSGMEAAKDTIDKVGKLTVQLNRSVTSFVKNMTPKVRNLRDNFAAKFNERFGAKLGRTIPQFKSRMQRSQEAVNFFKMNPEALKMTQKDLINITKRGNPESQVLVQKAGGTRELKNFAKQKSKAEKAIKKGWESYKTPAARAKEWYKKWDDKIKSYSPKNLNKRLNNWTAQRLKNIGGSLKNRFFETKIGGRASAFLSKHQNLTKTVKNAAKKGKEIVGKVNTGVSKALDALKSGMLKFIGGVMLVYVFVILIAMVCVLVVMFLSSFEATDEWLVDAWESFISALQAAGDLLSGSSS